MRLRRGHYLVIIRTCVIVSTLLTLLVVWDYSYDMNEVGRCAQVLFLPLNILFLYKIIYIHSLFDCI